MNRFTYMAGTERFSVGWLRLIALARLFPAFFKRNRAAGLVRLGSDLGGWWVPSTGLSRDSVCYCVGVGEDVTFDLALVDRFNCQVVSLDPTPKAVTYMSDLSTPRELKFLPVGVAGSNREARFYSPRDPTHASFSISNLQQTTDFVLAPVRTLRSLMEELGHDRMDLLKLDIEGAEYEVPDSLHRDNIYPSTLCVEFDQPHSAFDTWRAVRRLHSAGYETVSVDRFNFTFVHDSAPCTPDEALSQ
jgi:FkbM family methyltransferase